MYGFNPLTPLDLLSLPANELVSVDGSKKVYVVKSIHKKVRQQIGKKNEQIVAKVNKGRYIVTFEPGDWVWVQS